MTAVTWSDSGQAHHPTITIYTSDNGVRMLTNAECRRYSNARIHCCCHWERDMRMQTAALARSTRVRRIDGWVDGLGQHGQWA